MKNRWLLFSLCALLSGMAVSCNSGSEGETEVTTDMVMETTTIAFDEEVHDFGPITQGEKVSHVFTFTNTGQHDLVITSAKSSCGCTVPRWPKKPIPPGGKGEIEVEYDSSGKKGQQHKKITIVANTEPSTNVVAIKTDVVAPDTNE